MNRPRFYCLFTLLIVLSIGTAARADVDQSSPMATERSFWSAIDQGDADAAKKVCKTDETQAKWVENFATMCDGFRKLHDSAINRFGNDTKAFTDHTPGYHALQLLDKCTVKLEGEKATILVPGENTRGMMLVREDGKWVLDLKSSLAGDLTQPAAAYKAVSDAAHEVAADIDGGKYETAGDAETDFKKKLQAAIASHKVVPGK